MFVHRSKLNRSNYARRYLVICFGPDYSKEINKRPNACLPVNLILPDIHTFFVQLEKAIEEIKALNATEKGSLNVRKINTFFFLIHWFFVYLFCSFYFCHIEDATTRIDNLCLDIDRFLLRLSETFLKSLKMKERR